MAIKRNADGSLTIYREDEATAEKPVEEKPVKTVKKASKKTAKK